MSTTTKHTAVFEGVWGSRVYAFGLDEPSTREAVEDGYAFGDPSEDDYAVGCKWAESEYDEGWRIVERLVEVASVAGEKLGDSSKGETVHVNWKCPHCDRQFSEDVYDDDASPMLLRCGCNDEEKYVLVEF